jgi:hypothetical protein
MSRNESKEVMPGCLFSNIRPEGGALAYFASEYAGMSMCGDSMEKEFNHGVHEEHGGMAQNIQNSVL